MSVKDDRHSRGALSPREALVILKAWVLGGLVLGIASWVAVATIFSSNGHDLPGAVGMGIGLVMSVATTIGGLVRWRGLP